MPPEVLFDVTKVDDGRVLFNQEQILAVNPQRHEMVQLTAIAHMDTTNKVIVGYKDVKGDEFWVRGHMPGFPLLPGVLMCEAAAQLTGFFAKKLDIVAGAIIVFSGMNNIRFRGQVKIGDRFWLVGKGDKLNRRQVSFNVQGFVKDKMVFEGDIIGMPFTPASDGVAEA
jgi:3-hydroxyacyl-[acyl-carrier-protein] dehydratase